MSRGDRIRELRRVPARELIPHERNWRVHPPEQAAALADILAEMGYADALLVRQREDGRLVILDGHLRAATTPDQLVPVLVLDVSEAEAEQILLTHDPLALLATANEPAMAKLIAETDFDSPAVRALLDGLQEHFAQGSLAEEPSAEPPEVAIRNSFQVAVECRDEPEQAALFRRLTGEGYSCRLLTL